MLVKVEPPSGLPNNDMSFLAAAGGWLGAASDAPKSNEFESTRGAAVKAPPKSAANISSVAGAALSSTLLVFVVLGFSPNALVKSPKSFSSSRGLNSKSSFVSLRDDGGEGGGHVLKTDFAVELEMGT